jgi:hypothetical protein
MVRRRSAHGAPPPLRRTCVAGDVHAAACDEQLTVSAVPVSAPPLLRRTCEKGDVHAAAVPVGAPPLLRRTCEKGDVHAAAFFGGSTYSYAKGLTQKGRPLTGPPFLVKRVD